ncbi:rpsU-divergently transcribed protein [Aphanomyces invadans]|uniref:Ubiquinone biosynthesis protein n=1 Tax=Aphanomyces invadans TaxID=157072 RepID=A0A024U3F1_9STRA|nr:rpsU-divergently transcribed protein [Aphanomyces invadans]ETW00789.1 rpsU-divergently transcribed protein [Aphanomyces invadans]|eukprot:XP_008870924.1 rpsU-divergently transcribed protein [Aphanomyces invadans]
MNMLRLASRRATLVTRCFSTAQPATAAASATQQQDPSQLILSCALNHVKTQGWSIESLGSGARDAGYPSVAHGMFPRGPIELVEYFMDDLQHTVQDKLAAESTVVDIPVTDRLKRGIRVRLELLAPYISVWPQAMALGALPQNAPTTMKKLAEMIDDIWVFAGDRTTDMSWYTKRAVLTGVYTATELFMLSDHSPNHEETWKFLDRRIEEAIALGDIPNNAQDVAGMVSIGIQSLLSTAAALAGPVTQQVVQQVGQHVPNPISAFPSTTFPFKKSPFTYASSVPPPPTVPTPAPATAPLDPVLAATPPPTVGPLDSAPPVAKSTSSP